MNKLETLAKIEGYANSSDLLEAVGYICPDVPAICTNQGCDYTVIYEPDSTKGWCECCNTNSVASALVLAGMI